MLKNKGKGRGFFQKIKCKKDKENYYQNPQKCKYCNFPLSYDKKINTFCGHSCAASFNNKGVVRNGKSPEVKKCFNCEELTKNPKCCSHTCLMEYKCKSRWETIRKTGKIINKEDKKFLIHERGHKCEICQNSEWLNNPILLILDHIDGNSDNNALPNLRLVCSNCDATLPTYKGRNKKNGRDSIRQQYRKNRYKNGSCN